MTNTQVLVLATTRNGYVLLADDRLPGAPVPHHGDLALTGRLALAGQTGLLADITHAWTVHPTGTDNTGELWILDGGTHNTVPDTTEDTNPNARWAPITTFAQDPAIREALDARDTGTSIQIPTV
ncbi:hypothetical protein [Streptomyces sp. NBRC 109706]|uniref:hypothetical protein n=1 Tax=Streptomyces sp. NBRC 109706 TaxID=1550035 RepID=UPI0007863996|nr:hypothetical protein [Streptomyces sp. NBRC 109706]